MEVVDEVIGGESRNLRPPLGVTAFLACNVTRTSFAARAHGNATSTASLGIVFTSSCRYKFSPTLKVSLKTALVTRVFPEKLSRRSHDEYRRALQGKSPDI